MAYFLDLFSPITYEAYGRSDRTITGFRTRLQGIAQRIQPGDKFICYITKLGRWCGVLEVASNCFLDDAPIFYPDQDPFTLRFRVEPHVWLNVESSLPIRDDRIWNNLSFTQGQDKGTSNWTGRLRASLTKMDESDAAFLEEMLFSQAERGEMFPVDEREYSKYMLHPVRAQTGTVAVSVPEDTGEDEPQEQAPQLEARESIRIQAALARIGSEMGMKIWVPRADRGRVLQEWQDGPAFLLDELPLNYDSSTIKTIEQIDILWLRGRSIARAFEVEHTTSIYSGLLRMADLLALQPNLNIRLHIVAPSARREKVLHEITRPVFSLLDQGPLSSKCTYISYDSIEELAAERHLAHLSDSVLDEYSEEAE